jgi:DHA2 family multidrug resistance protein
MTSWLSQQFGRRNYFAVSIIIFTVAFLCGNATNIWELVTFRLFKVLEVALLVTAQTIITESYPIAKEDGTSHLRNGCDCRTYASPPLEAILWIAWPYIFYINIPLGIIATL